MNPYHRDADGRTPTAVFKCRISSSLVDGKSPEEVEETITQILSRKVAEGSAAHFFIVPGHGVVEWQLLASNRSTVVPNDVVRAIAHRFGIDKDDPRILSVEYAATISARGEGKNPGSPRTGIYQGRRFGGKAQVS